MTDEEPKTGRELFINVPFLPPPTLNPNRKAHWVKKSTAANYYSWIVTTFAISARNAWEQVSGRRWEPLMNAEIRLTFIFGPRHRGPLPDQDNLMASFKPGLDALTARERNGLIGACIIQDDSPQHMHLRVDRPERGDSDSVVIQVRTPEELEG